MILEVIGYNIEGCIVVQTAGANRIELCDSPADGGTTPSFGFINSARKLLDIELYTMIRPRGGDFIYSDEEFRMMIDDIKICKQLGCDGIVTGILTKDNNVDKERCRIIVEYAYPLGVTFHRAFDRTYDPFEAMEDIIDIGFERILTSGQKPTAEEGLELIRELIEKSDDRIIIMPGSGIRSDNIIDIANKTGATEFHTSARLQTDRGMTVDKTEVQLMIQNLRNRH